MGEGEGEGRTARGGGTGLCSSPISLSESGKGLGDHGSTWGCQNSPSTDAGDTSPFCGLGGAAGGGRGLPT